MAKVILRTGRILFVVVAVLAFAVVMGLTVFSNAQLPEPFVLPDDPNEPQFVSAGDIVSEVRQEIVEQRGRNRRVWEVVREVAVSDEVDGLVEVEESTSRIIEVGTGICYEDKQGEWQVTNASWRATDTGFVMDEAGYSLEIDRTIDSWLRHTVDGEVMYFRPDKIVAFDGQAMETIALLDKKCEGVIDPNDASRLVFYNAFGEGIDLELVVRPAGYHQNVIFHDEPPLSENLDPATTKIHLFTEVNLDDYDASGMVDIIAGSSVRIQSAELADTPPTTDDIKFVKLFEENGEIYEYDLHRLVASEVFDSAGGNQRKKTVAKKSLVKDMSGGSYLVETLDKSFFETASYPVTWDYSDVSGNFDPNDGHWYANATYYVSDDFEVDEAELRIEPGTFVKFAAGKKLFTSGTGKIIARGRPYLPIYFTSKDDNYNGETITGSDGSPSPGDWVGLEIGDDSEVEFCKIMCAETALKVSGAPAIDIRNLHTGSSLDCAIDITSNAGAVTIFNNSLIYCNGGTDPTAIKVSGSSGSVNIVNNTMDTNAKGIAIDGSCTRQVTAINNIMANSSTAGIYAPGAYDPNYLTNNYNGYYNNTADISGVFSEPNSVTITETPYATDSLYFISRCLNTNTNGGAKFIDAGSCSVEAAGFDDPNLWLTLYPENIYTTAQSISTDTTWQPDYDTCDFGAVDLGYHHQRIDYVIHKADVTVSGATLTVNPGTVIAQKINDSTDAGKLIISSNAKLICNGDPFGDGYITWSEQGLIKYYWKTYFNGISADADTYIDIYGDYEISFSKFQGMGWAIVTGTDPGTIRDCIFQMNKFGIKANSSTDFDYSNNLFVNNNCGIHAGNCTGSIINCTFDRCEMFGAVSVGSGGTLNITNCLFRKIAASYSGSNAYAAISDWDETATINESYNAFYDNFIDLGEGTSASTAVQDLDSTDWTDDTGAAYASIISDDLFDPAWTNFADKIYLDPNSAAVDNGYDPDARGMYGYTTQLSRDEDLSPIDIGYHYPLPYETDLDGLMDYEEYWLGTDPNDPDTDDDELSDYDEARVYGTDPLNPDTDGDFMPDGWEVTYQLDPLDSTGIDGADGDLDNDGYVNLTEYLHGTNPNDDQSLPQASIIVVPDSISIIQKAIDYSIDYDVIEVMPGTYEENIDFKDKTVLVRSLYPDYWGTIRSTIIEADDPNLAVITFDDSQCTESIVAGFTIRNGQYGVDCSNSPDPIIANCYIEDNTSHGIRCSSGDPLITNNIITANGGNGVYSSSTTPPEIKNNWIHNNTGKGIEIVSATDETIVRNNTIVGNNAQGIRVSSSTAPLISNCILWDNNDDLDGCAGTYSCIEDADAGTGNISTDPMLLNAGNGVYFPDPNSPCVDTGDPDPSYYYEFDIDHRSRVLNGTVDMGCCEYADGVLPENEPLPYMTSFQWFEGYNWGSSLHYQNNWVVDEGDAWISGIFGRGWCWQYAVVDANSVVSKTFDSDGVYDEVFRFRIGPGKGTEIRIISDANSIAGVRFAEDFSIQILDDGVYSDTGVSWESYWLEDSRYLAEITIDVEYGDSHYDVYLDDEFVSDVNYVGDYPTFTDVEIETTYDWAVIDRFSVTGNIDGSLSRGITTPCACKDDQIEGKIAVKGNVWWEDMGWYELVYCPAEWIEDVSELENPYIWQVFDKGYNTVANNGLLGYWDTTGLPNGQYYLGLIIVDSYGFFAELSRIGKTLSINGQIVYDGPAQFSVVGNFKSSFVHQEEPDISVKWPGQFPFEFRRTFNSLRRYKSKPLLNGWSDNNHITLTEDTTYFWQTIDNDFGEEYEFYVGEPAYDKNMIAYGHIWITYPDGSNKLFVHKTKENNEENPIYVPHAEDGSGEFIIRSTFVESYTDTSRLEGVYYELRTRDGTKLIFDTGDISDQNIWYYNTQGSYGTAIWQVTAPLQVMADRFGNQLSYTWNSDRTALTEITDGVSAIRFDEDQYGYYSEVRLENDDPNNGGVLQKVTFGWDSEQGAYKVAKTGYAVDENGVFDSSTTQDKVTLYGYSGYSVNRVAYDNSINNPAIDVWYDNYGRMEARRDYVDSSTYRDTVYGYSFYHPDPMDTDISYMTTTEDTYDGYDLFERRVTATQDQFGQLVSQNTLTWDGSAVVDANSLYESHWMEVDPEKPYVLRPLHPHRPKETNEFFDGEVRKTATTYNPHHDPTSQKVYTDSYHYVATEMSYHPDLPFVTSKTSWQDYNKAGKKIQTLNVYGNADGTENSTGLYMVKEKVFLDDNDTTDPNYHDWAVTSYKYYSNGLVKEKIDPDGNHTLLSYDGLGSVKQVWVATADANDVPDQRFFNDVKGRQVLSATRLGAVVYNQYDDFDRVYRVLKYDDPNAVVISYGELLPGRYYDPNSSDPNSGVFAPWEPVDVVEYGYDIYGRRTFEKGSHGGTVKTTYTTGGLPEKVTYDDSSYVEYYYDGLGRKTIEYKYEAGSDFAWDVWYYYDGMDRPWWVRWFEDADYWETVKEQVSWYWGTGKKKWDTIFGVGLEYETAVEYEYDVLDRLTKRIVDPNDGGLQLTTEYGYDAAGNRTSVIDPEDNAIYYDYDNSGRKVGEYFALSSTADPNDAVLSKAISYYATGKVKQVKQYDYDSTLLAQKDFEYDDHGRIDQVTEKIDGSNDAVTTYYYDDAGFDVNDLTYHIRITDAEDKDTCIALDAFGRRVETLYPSGDYEHSIYNGDGTLASKAVWDDNDVKQWIDYYYDSYGRIEDVNYPDSGNIHYAYDGFGRKTAVTDNRNAADNIGGDETISYEYDALDRITKITDHDDWVIEYTYMSDGQKSQIKVLHPDDATVKYHVAYLYDKALRLEYVSEPLLGLSTPWIAGFGYDDNGNRETLTYYRDGTLGGNTTAMSYTYNGDNRLTAYSTTGGITFSLSSTTVDGLGRLIEADETLTNPNSSTVSHSHDYTYDMRSQLTDASVTNIGGSTWTADYNYRKDGNIDDETVAGSSADFEYDGDLMTDKGNDSLSWDLNGQMTTGISSSMTWNWNGKLQSASAGGDSIDLKYAPGFDRVYKESTVSETTTKSKYIVDPTGDLSLILLEIDPDENDPNDAIRKTYIYANSQTIAQHDGYYGADIYFYLHDRLGSTRQLIDTSANVKNKYVYQPFGESFSSEQAENVSNDFMFTGQYFDSEIDQYYLRARQYELAIYRFPSRDSYEGSLENPLEVHRYLYCLNEPISSFDPTGKMALLSLAIGSGGSTWLRSAEATYKVGLATSVGGGLLWLVSQRNEGFDAAIDAAYYGVSDLFDFALYLAQTAGLGHAADRTAGWGGKKVGDIISENRIRGSNIEGCPRPPGGPDWKDILKMTWDDIVKAAKAGKKWAKTIKKEMLKRDNWPK